MFFFVQVCYQDTNFASYVAGSASTATWASSSDGSGDLAVTVTQTDTDQIQRCSDMLPFLKNSFPVADPGFPEVGVPTLQGAPTHDFAKIFLKTAWNWKNLDAGEGWGRPSRALRSASVSN